MLCKQKDASMGWDGRKRVEKSRGALEVGRGRGEKYVGWFGIELFPCDERSINWLDDLFCASLLRC